jgi:hypothetical protein
MDELIARLNGLTTYLSITDLHNLATELKEYSEAGIATLLAALTNPVLVNDIKLLTTGNLPSTLTAPVHVLPTLPTDPDHPELDRDSDPGFAKGTAPEIKPAV